MLNANAICTVRKVSGFDVYGKPAFGVAFNEPCAVVVARGEQQNTTVRADSSQSRGHGDEFTSTHKILLSGETRVKLGDQITLRGRLIRVMTMHDRYDVGGTIDHFEVTGELWA